MQTLRIHLAARLFRSVFNDCLTADEIMQRRVKYEDKQEFHNLWGYGKARLWPLRTYYTGVRAETERKIMTSLRHKCPVPTTMNNNNVSINNCTVIA
jgi:hypothetical protein